MVAHPHCRHNRVNLWKVLTWWSMWLVKSDEPHGKHVTSLIINNNPNETYKGDHIYRIGTLEVSLWSWSLIVERKVRIGIWGTYICADVLIMVQLPYKMVRWYRAVSMGEMVSNKEGGIGNWKLADISQQQKMNGIISPSTWYRHQMEAHSALLALCAGNSPANGEFPSQRASNAELSCVFDVSQSKFLSKRSNGRLPGTPWCSCDVSLMKHRGICRYMHVCIYVCMYVCIKNVKLMKRALKYSSYGYSNHLMGQSIYLPIFGRIASLALRQNYDLPQQKRFNWYFPSICHIVDRRRGQGTFLYVFYNLKVKNRKRTDAFNIVLITCRHQPLMKAQPINVVNAVNVRWISFVDTYQI